ncbi:MAG: T9SS type A sorting domain-containing protein [bacterium]
MKFIAIIFFFLLPFTVFSRKEANIWYFGNNAGLDFNSGQPVALLDGKLNSNEGCATISDKNGNLIFYTDGVTVWNRNHAVMPNGSGLMGHNSSTQSAVIVPVPESGNLFYIFTVDDKDRSGGFRYSLVDMSLDNGLGDVIAATKNVLLFAPSAEKIAAVNNFDCSGVWVMSHEWNSNVYRAYLVTSSGIDTMPVISKVGIKYEGSVHNKKGYLKANTDGTKIATASGYTATFELFDFDNVTGELSNPVKLEYSDWEAYGVEFSPDSKKLYASANTRSFWWWSENELWQFNIESGNQSQILNSKRTIATQNYSNQYGALQLATNGKIYVARQNSGTVGAVQNPDELGSNCNYVNNDVFLEGRTCVWGLPFFIQSYFYNNSYISFPEIRSKVGNKNVPVKLIANLNCGNTDTLKAGFDATVRIDAKVYYIKSVENCNLISKTMDRDGFMTLHLSAESLQITSEPQVLATLRGDVLLSMDSDTSILDIVDFNWTGNTIHTEKQNGKILAYGVCVQDIRKIKKIEEESLIINPNPAEDFIEITIKSSNNEPRDLTIFNQQGIEVWHYELHEKSGSNLTHIYPDITDFPSGVYFVELKTTYNRIIEKIIVY